MILIHIFIITNIFLLFYDKSLFDMEKKKQETSVIIFAKVIWSWIHLLFAVLSHMVYKMLKIGIKR